MVAEDGYVGEVAHEELVAVGAEDAEGEAQEAVNHSDAAVGAGEVLPGGFGWGGFAGEEVGGAGEGGEGAGGVEGVG